MVKQMSESQKSCPHCAEIVADEAILCRFCDRGISKEHYKNCPFCAEMIWTDAVFCRYCKSTLNGKSAWPQLSRKKLFTLDEAATLFKLDDAAIDKIFEKIGVKKK